MADNPPAFPNTGNSNWGLRAEAGMDLRDWFAGQALTGFCSMSNPLGEWTWQIRDATQCAYEIADAMLAERERVK